MAGSPGDVVASALRLRRKWKLSAGAALALAVASALYSHFTAPRPVSELSGQQARVERVIDGDTIVIKQADGHQEHVRLLGIDAPEVVHPGSPTDMYFGPEARTYLKKRLEGQTVTLKSDEPQSRDRYQRLLAYIYLNDSENVNLTEIKDGMAYVDRRFKCSVRPQMEQAETAARTKKIGLWNGVSKQDMPPWRQKWMDERHLDD